MVGSGGNLQLAGLDELLVAPIQQARDLAVQQPAGTGQYLDRAIRSGGNLRRTAVFPYLNSFGVRFAPSCAGATSNLWPPSRARTSLKVRGGVFFAISVIR